MTIDVAAVVAETEQAAQQRQRRPDYPAGYLARVRDATSRLDAIEVGPDDIRGALTVVEQHLPIEVDMPVASSRRAVTLVKKLVRRLTIYPVRSTADQVTMLGQAMVRVGDAITQRVERLEGHAGDIDRLRERVERLEAQLGPHQQ